MKPIFGTLVFRELDQGARNDLFATKGSDLRCFVKHAGRIILGHVSHPENLLPVLIVDDDQILFGSEVIFDLEFACAREVAIRIEDLDLDFPFAGEFIFF